MDRSLIPPDPGRYTVLRLRALSAVLARAKASGQAHERVCGANRNGG